MRVFNRFRTRANNDFANNLATVIERFYQSDETQIIEQVTEDAIPLFYILKGNSFTIATYTPLQRNERFRSPISLDLTTYSVNDILKIEEKYEEHSLQNEDYLSLYTVIHFKDGHKVEISDNHGLYSRSTLTEFYEDHKTFIQALKEII